MNTEEFPRFALSAEFDAKSWSGVDVMIIDGTTITIPETTGLIYRDALQFLHGHGSASAQSFPGRFKAAMTGLGLDAADFDVAIDEDDKFHIYNDDANVAIVLNAGANNIYWGFSAAGQNLSTDLGDPLIATGEWLREPIMKPGIEVPPSLSFTIYNGGGAIGTFAVAIEEWIQSPVTHVRTRGSVGDYMDTTLPTFEGQLQAGAGTTTGIRVLVVDGHVVICIRSSAGMDLTEVTWLSTTFRDRLGFSGLETTVTRPVGGGLVYLVAQHPLPGFIEPVRPCIHLNPKYEHSGDSKRLVGGSYSSVTTGVYHGWNLRFKLQGPATGNDELTHFMRNCLKYMTPGKRVLLYQDWPEPRTRMFLHEHTVSQPLYDNSRTSQEDGYRGVILGRIHGDSLQDLNPGWNAPFRQFTDEMTIDLADTFR